eukprot:15073939-Alexandrium_andersonii.AAC.1
MTRGRRVRVTPALMLHLASHVPALVTAVEAAAPSRATGGVLTTVERPAVLLRQLADVTRPVPFQAVW